jgi:hypothetical protein
MRGILDLCKPAKKWAGGRVGTLELSRSGLFAGQSCDRAQVNITAKDAEGDGCNN